MKYQVIARKYRPKTFASVVGQEAIVTTLKNALRLKRLAHAYLFCGCRGTGKTTLARVFAKALNCSNPTEDFEPCNQCSSCQDINAARSLDVLEIDGASNRGIDDIRQINETIGYAPASGKYKIYIIDEVHMLTKEAFNALLKTLEEPPENVKFFFATTEPHKVIPTILSRCQRFDLNRIAFDALKSKLAWIAQDMGVACEEEALSLVAHLSEGSLRDAESLLDQIICYAEPPITAAKVISALGITPRSAFFSIDAAFEEENLSFAFEMAADLFSSGKDLAHFMEGLIEHFRTHLKIKLGAELSLPTAQLEKHYAASSYTEEQCLYILDFLIQWQQQMGKTPFKRVSLEMILLHIIRSKHRIALPTLIRRLQELEQKALPPKEEKPEVVLTENAAPVPPPKEEKPEVVLTESAALEPSPKEEKPSVEEVLMGKIQEKIDAAAKEEIAEPPKLAPLLLSKEKWEAAAAESTSPSVPENLECEQAPNRCYDTVMRFAAVELEGTLKKELL